ncbi:DJ-1 family glyoxalase III [Caldithrix abyssi]
MSKALVVLAPGFEEIEAITIIDLLRRADIQVTVAGLQPNAITGSHHITVVPDTDIQHVKHETFDMLILPGGQPGTNNLKSDETLLGWIKERFTQGKKLAAICAAPTVFHAAGITKNLKITSYPSEKKVFTDSQYLEEAVVKDGPVITSRGVGTAIPFALRLIEELKDRQTAQQVAERILFEGRW